MPKFLEMCRKFAKSGEGFPKFPKLKKVIQRTLYSFCHFTNSFASLEETREVDEAADVPSLRVDDGEPVLAPDVGPYLPAHPLELVEQPQGLAACCHLARFILERRLQGEGGRL